MWIIPYVSKQKISLSLLLLSFFFFSVVFWREGGREGEGEGGSGVIVTPSLFSSLVMLLAFYFYFL